MRKKQIEFCFNSKSIVKVQRAYQRHFGVKAAPERKAVWRIVKKFQTSGTVYSLNKGRSGRRRDVRISRNINAVRCSAIPRLKINWVVISRVGHEWNEHCPYFETGFETLSVSHLH